MNIREIDGQTLGASVHSRMTKTVECNVRSGLNSHYFHIIGDGHQPNSRGLYTHYKDSLAQMEILTNVQNFWENFGASWCSLATQVPPEDTLPLHSMSLRLKDPEGIQRLAETGSLVKNLRETDGNHGTSISWNEFPQATFMEESSAS